MISFKLTPTHFAELAWAKMRITAHGKPQATVPDLVRLLNLERAILDAQQYTAHQIADTLPDAEARRVREEADRAYQFRWTEIGLLISALGDHGELVDIDWTEGDIQFAALNVPAGFNISTWEAAQRSQLPLDFLNPHPPGACESVRSELMKRVSRHRAGGSIADDHQS